MSKSATIIDPVHPGEILREEFLGERGLSATALGTTPEFWMNLQMRFDLETARADRKLAERLGTIQAVA